MNIYKSNILKIYIFRFLMGMHFVAGVLIPFFIDWGGISFTRAMILQSFFVISVLVLEVPTGAIADHYGRKTSLILAAFVSSFAAVVYSSIPNFYIFLIGEFLWAVSYALLSGSDEALVYDTLKRLKLDKKSKMILGRYRSFEIAALIVAPPIGSLIASKIGLRYSMMFMFIPQFLAFLLAFTFREVEVKKEIDYQRGYLETLKSGIKYFKDHRVLKILAFDRISINATVFFIIWTYQLLLKKINIPIFYFGIVHAAMAGIQVIIMNNFERLENIFGSKRRYLLFTALLSGVSFIILGVNKSVPLVIILILLIAGFGLSRNVLFQSYMNKYIESYNRATVISTVSMLNRFLSAILYPIVGLIVEKSLNHSFIIIGTLIIFCSMISRVKEEHLLD